MMECQSQVVFVFERLVCSPVILATGLAQGCPLSCILYILAVDGMLEYVSKVAGVSQVVAFCDDWSIECEEVVAVSGVQQIITRFEKASGQRMNRLRSEILPTQQADEDTLQSLREDWPECMVVCQAKVLGLLLGYNLSADDYYNEVEARYVERISELRLIPMTVPMRVLVLNIFVRSLLSYVGRFVLMPLPGFRHSRRTTHRSYRGCHTSQLGSLVT